MQAALQDEEEEEGKYEMGAGQPPVESSSDDDEDQDNANGQDHEPSLAQPSQQEFQQGPGFYQAAPAPPNMMMTPTAAQQFVPPVHPFMANGRGYAGSLTQEWDQFTSTHTNNHYSLVMKERAMLAAAGNNASSMVGVNIGMHQNVPMQSNHLAPPVATNNASLRAPPPARAAADSPNGSDDVANSGSTSSAESGRKKKKKTASKQQKKKAPAASKKDKATKAAGSGGGRSMAYKKNEMEELGRIILTHLPMGFNEWTKIETDYNDTFPDRPRMAENLRRKYNELKKKKAPTGNPNVPEYVRLIREAHTQIVRKSNATCGNSDDDNYEVIDSDDGDEDADADDEEEIADNADDEAEEECVATEENAAAGRKNNEDDSVSVLMNFDPSANDDEGYTTSQIINPGESVVHTPRPGNHWSTLQRPKLVSGSKKTKSQKPKKGGVHRHCAVKNTDDDDDGDVKALLNVYLASQEERRSSEEARWHRSQEMMMQMVTQAVTTYANVQMQQQPNASFRSAPAPAAAASSSLLPRHHQPREDCLDDWDIDDDGSDSDDSLWTKELKRRRRAKKAKKQHYKY